MRSTTETVETELRVSIPIGSSSALRDSVPHIRIEDDRSGVLVADIELSAADLTNMLGGRTVNVKAVLTTDSGKLGKYVVAHSERFERKAGNANTREQAEAYAEQLREEGEDPVVRDNNFGNTVIYWTYHDEPQTDWQRRGL